MWRAILERDSPDLLVGRSIRLSSTPNFAVPFDRTRIGVARLALLASGLAVVVTVATLSNLAGLLMLRAIRRRPSDATRVAIGGGPWLASRAVLTEALTLGVAAAILALLLQHATSGLLGAVLSLPAENLVTPDSGRGHYSAAMLLASCLLSGLLAGVLPAYHCRPTALATEVAGRAAHAPRLRNQALVLIPQVALATAVMMIAATVGVSVLRDERTAPGYDVDNLTYARFELPGPAERALSLLQPERYFWPGCVTSRITSPGTDCPVARWAVGAGPGAAAISGRSQPRPRGGTHGRRKTFPGMRRRGT